MTYRGHVQNGVIILDQPHTLPEGVEVEVDVIPLAEEAQPPKGSAAAVLKTLDRSGGLKGSDEEWDRLERMIQEDREADLRRSIQAGEWGPIEDLDQDYLNHLGIDAREVKQAKNEDLSF